MCTMPLEDLWQPLEDVGITSGLYLPGGYSVVGTQGVDATSQWTDESGNGRHFIHSPGITANRVPVAAAGGWPIFDGGANAGGLIQASSGNGGFTAAADGAWIVIASHDAPLGANVGNYQNAAMIAGSGATPSFVASDAGMRFTGYDGIAYVDAVDAGFIASTAYVCASKWDNIGIYRSRSGASWSGVIIYNAPQVSLDPANMGLDTYIGMGFGLAYNWLGPIKAAAFYPASDEVTDAKLVQWQDWAVLQGYV